MIQAIAQRIDEHAGMLNMLDSALGDGDHGTGISTAFLAAADDVKQLSNPDVMSILKATASALMNRMGGASGALYGTFFMKSALTTKEKNQLSKADCEEMFQACLQGVKQRGKSTVGDKTMVDALSPAIDAFISAPNLSDGWEHAANAASEGAESTINLVAKHGRAKFAGERSVGHMDAGAKSIALMFEAINLAWKEQTDGET